jgi:3-oxoacyl-[acyl-carrier protein] reductase
MPDALIWGASGGIGRALVQHLKTSGWRVFAAARDERRIPAEADFACGFKAGDENSIAACTLLVAQQTDSIDLMVYAVGGVMAQAVDAFSPDDWRQVMDANLNGFCYVMRNTVSLMARDGQVMVVGAYTDRIMLPKFGAYAAAKAGLVPLLTVLQKEQRHLRFTLVRPGAVKTPFWDHVPFRMPDSAMMPQAVAEAILKRYHSGEKGLLDL